MQSFGQTKKLLTKRAFLSYLKTLVCLWIGVFYYEFNKITIKKLNKVKFNIRIVYWIVYLPPPQGARLILKKLLLKNNANHHINCLILKILNISNVKICTFHNISVIKLNINNNYIFFSFPGLQYLYECVNWLANCTWSNSPSLRRPPEVALKNLQTVTRLKWSKNDQNRGVRGNAV